MQENILTHNSQKGKLGKSITIPKDADRRVRNPHYSTRQKPHKCRQFSPLPQICRKVDFLKIHYSQTFTFFQKFLKKPYASFTL